MTSMIGPARPDSSPSAGRLAILYLSRGFPLPPTSGQLRVFYFLQALAARHDVTYFCLLDRRDDAPDVATLESLGVRVRTFGRPSARRSPAGRLAGRARELLGRQTGLAEMHDAVAGAFARGAVDAVVTMKFTAPALIRRSGVPVVGDMCDIDSARLRASLVHTPAARLPGVLIDYLVMRAHEGRLVRVADRLIVASARDRDLLPTRSRRGHGAPGERGSQRSRSGVLVPPAAAPGRT